MEISEFIDTYSDDIIYLQEGRTALLTHPLRREVKDLCDGSFCRMLAVMMVGSIETMLQEWRERDKLDILGSYFAEGASNGERVQSLYDAFHRAGIKVDREVFDDYLAIKYLRNVIVHARWKPHEKEWLENRGFPTDTRELTEEHWKRMQAVNQNMMLYIALTGIAGPSKKPSDRVIKLSEAAKKDELWLVKKVDIPRIFWWNLERVSEHIYKDMERTVRTEEYNWAKGLSENDIKEMSRDERKRLFYLAARKAGQDRFHLLMQHEELATEALDFWKEYWGLTFDRFKISYEAMTTSTEVLRDLHQRRIYPKGPFIPWPKEMPPEIASKLIRGISEGYEPLREEQIAFALNIGSTVYDIMPNRTGLYLLLVQLPIVDPKNTDSYLEEGEKVLAAIELRDYWYSYVERRGAPDAQMWAFYRQMRDEFRRR